MDSAAIRRVTLELLDEKLPEAAVRAIAADILNVAEWPLSYNNHAGVTACLLGARELSPAQLTEIVARYAAHVTNWYIMAVTLGVDAPYLIAIDQRPNEHFPSDFKSAISDDLKPLAQELDARETAFLIAIIRAVESAADWRAEKRGTRITYSTIVCHPEGVPYKRCVGIMKAVYRIICMDGFMFDETREGLRLSRTEYVDCEKQPGE